MYILDDKIYLTDEIFKKKKLEELEKIKKKLNILNTDTKNLYMEFLNLEESILNDAIVENNRLTRLIAHYNIIYKLHDVLSSNLDMSRFILIENDNTEIEIFYKVDKTKTFKVLECDLKNLKYSNRKNNNPFILINHIKNINENISYYKRNIESLKKKSVYYDIGMRETIINSVALYYKREIERYKTKITTLYDYGKEIKEIEDFILEILSKEWHIEDTNYISSIKTIDEVIDRYNNYRSTDGSSVLNAKILKKTKFLDICKTLH